MASVNIQGLKGLTAKDRQDWETQLLSNIEGFESYSEEQKDRLYRNQEFKKAFGNNSDYELLKTYTPEQRDRYFANVAFKNLFGNNDDYESLKLKSPEERDLYYLDYNIRLLAESVFGKSKDWDIIKTLEPEVQKRLIEQGYATSEDREAWSKAMDENPKYNVTANAVDLSLTGTDEDLSFLNNAKAIGKSLREATKFGFKNPDAGLLEVGIKFTEEMEKNVPGGDTTTKRINSKLKNEAKESLNVLLNTIPAAIGDTWDFFSSLESTLDIAGNTKLVTSDKTKSWKETRLYDLWHNAPTRSEKARIESLYSDMLEKAIEDNDNLRIDKVNAEGKAQDYRKNYDYALSTSEGRAKFNEIWNNYISISPYGEEFGNTKYLNLPDSDKADILSTVNAINDKYSEQAAYSALNTILRETIADNTTTRDKSRNLTRNVLLQTTGVIGEAAMAVETGAIAVAEGVAEGMGYDVNWQNQFRQGTDMSYYKILWDPVYWSNLAQYGTWDPHEIRRIKYGVGGEAYNQALAQYKLIVQSQNPDIQINDADLEDSFRLQWIEDQWKEGLFRGNQISKYTTVRKAEDEGKLLGSLTLEESIGMAGQLMGQSLLVKGLGTIGKLGRVYALKGGPKGVSIMNNAEKLSALSQIAAPTLAISEAYAQGAYEQTFVTNRESLENYLNSSEAQEEINNLWYTSKDYYDKITSEQLAGKSVSKAYFNAYSRSLAEQDYRAAHYKNLDKGALSAYWTSFGIEALRYGHFNTTYRQWLFGDATRKLGLAKQNWTVGRSGAVNKLTSKLISRNFAKEAFNSGWTNYLDETTTAFSLGFGTLQFNDYLGNYYNNNEDYNNMLGDLMAGIHSASQSFTEDSSIRAFAIGSMGFFTGGNFANIATAWITPEKAQFTPKEVAQRLAEGKSTEMSDAEARDLLKLRLGLKESDYSAGRISLEWMAYLTGNSALKNITQQLGEADYSTRLCNQINALLSKDERLLESNETARALANFIQLSENALDFDDEMVQKNTSYMLAFNLLSTLQSMRDSGTKESSTYTNFMQKLEAIENGEITDEDFDSFLNNPANADAMALLKDDETKRRYAASRIAKNVAKFREIELSWEKNSEILSKVFKDISTSSKDILDIYYDALFKMSLQDDFSSRLLSMEEEISNNQKVNTTSNPTIYRAIATEGTKTKVINSTILILEAQKKILDTEINSNSKKLKESKLSNKERTELLDENIRLSNQKDRVNSLILKYNQEVQNMLQALEEAHLNQIEDEILTADEILRLNPEERLFVLTNSDSFSYKQQSAINEAKSILLNKFGKDYLKQLRDINIINSRMQLNQQYINSILEGNINDALLNYRHMRTRKALETLDYTAKETLRSLIPMLKVNEVTPDLIKATVGMPKLGLDTLKKLAPLYSNVLNNLQSILTLITFYDLAIDRLGLSNIEKEEATRVMFNILSKAKTKDDISRLLGEAILDSPQWKKDLITSILRRALEYVNLLNPVTETKQLDEKVETKKEEKKEESKLEEDKKEESKDETKESSETSIPLLQLEAEEKPDMSKAVSLEEIILDKADLNSGKFITPTIEEEVKSNPLIKDAPVTSITILSADLIEAIENLINTQGTSMLGNWINGYNYLTLRKSGVLVVTVGRSAGDLYNNYIEWMKANLINYQDVVDFELAALLEKNPKLPIRMLVTKGDENATRDNLIKDAILLVVEATPEVKKIHKEERSPYLKVGDKEYLVIGRAGLEREHTIAQSNNYNTMVNNINSRSKDYFELNPTERFYVDTEYLTLVRYVNGGNLTKRLTTDSEVEQNRDVAEMLGDALRDPLGFNKIENLAWGIQVGGEFRVFGLSENVEYYSPLNSEKVSGTVFIMIPIGNGKYIPAKINAAMTTTIKDGELKNRINTEFEKLVSPDVAVRREGISNLCKVLVLTDSSNILVGGEGFNTVTIIDNGAKTEYDLEHSNSLDVLNAIKGTPFRINIQSFTFTDPVLLKLYANAGVFRTDLAVLSCTGNYYSVYSCDANGKLLTATANVGNADYVSTAPNIDSVVYNEGTYRYEDGQWTAPNGQKVISPTVIEILTYLKQIRDNDINPVEQIKDNKGKAWDFYVISEDTNNPVVIKEDRHGHAFKATKQQAIEYLKGYAEKQAKQQREEAAKTRLNELLNQAETIDLFAEENKPLVLQQVQPLSQQLVQLSTPITVQEAKPVLETKEVPLETVKKPILNLQESEKSLNFALIYSDRNMLNQFLDLIEEKFGDELPETNENASIEEEINDLVYFLKSKDIPVENITNFDSWLELIKNCR